MKFGLSEDEFLYLTKELIEPLKKHGARVYIFGSRASGKYKQFSDIDVLYVYSQPSETLSLLAHQCLENIEKSDFIYKIDLVDASTLVESYKKNILKERIKV